MRISDWSSDVCSSDLVPTSPGSQKADGPAGVRWNRHARVPDVDLYRRRGYGDCRKPTRSPGNLLEHCAVPGYAPCSRTNAVGNEGDQQGGQARVVTRLDRKSTRLNSSH